MNTTDYVVNAALILIVVRQIRGGRLDLAGLVLPVVLVAGAAAYYLRSVPTTGSDLYLELALGATGALVGVLCGLATRVWRQDGVVYARAGVLAALLWIGGIGARTAFALASDHTGFSGTVADFSRRNDITGPDAWVAAFVMMALAEAVARLVTIRARAALTRAGADRADQVGLAV